MRMNESGQLPEHTDGATVWLKRRQRRRARARRTFRLQSGPVSGDVGEPGLVRRISGERGADPPIISHGAQIVVDGRSGLLAIAAPHPPGRGPSAVARRYPPSGPIRHDLACVAGLVGQEPVPEPGIVAARIEQRVRAIRLHNLARGMELVSHREYGWREIFNTRHVTVTGIPTQASSATNRENPSRTGSPATHTPLPAATPRPPAPATGFAHAPPAAQQPRPATGQTSHPRRYRHDATTSATPPDEPRNHQRPARPSRQTRNSSPRAQHRHETQTDKTQPQQHHPSPPTGNPSQTPTIRAANPVDVLDADGHDVLGSV